MKLKAKNLKQKKPSEIGTSYWKGYWTIYRAIKIAWHKKQCEAAGECMIKKKLVLLTFLEFDQTTKKKTTLVTY